MTVGSGRRRASPGALSSAVFDEAVLRLPDEWQSRVERAGARRGSPGAGLLEAADREGRRADRRRFSRHGIVRAISAGQREPGGRPNGAGAGAGGQDDRRTGERKDRRHAGRHVPRAGGLRRVGIRRTDCRARGEAVLARRRARLGDDASCRRCSYINCPTGCSPCSAIRTCRPWPRPGRRSTTSNSSRPSTI